MQNRGVRDPEPVGEGGAHAVAPATIGSLQEVHGGDVV